MGDDEAQRRCSDCGTKVPVKETECPYCGLNLDTGQSFEVKVKQAKPNRSHQATPLSTLLVMPVIAFALIVFAGYMYQRRAESIMDNNKSAVEPILTKLEKADNLARFGKKAEAKKMCEQAIEDIKDAASDDGSSRSSNEDDEGAAERKKGLLMSLQAKAERKMQQYSQ